MHQLLFIFIIVLIPFSSKPQKDTPSSIIKESEKANSDITIESYFPVDNTQFDFNYIYLDLDFKPTKKIITKKYRIISNEINYFDVAKLPNSKPETSVLGSLSQSENWGGSIINEGAICFKKGRAYWYYTIRNKKVIMITLKSVKKILFSQSPITLGSI